MQFSRKIDYGLILLETLKLTYDSRRYASLKSIAQKRNLPFPFLEKVAARLRKVGLIESKKGVAGGYRLASNPKYLTLKGVIDIFEEPRMMRCLGSPHPEKACSLAKSCPTRKTWNNIDAKIDRFFETVTIAKL